MSGDNWMLDSGIACAYDGDVIEYTDGVIVMLVIKPYIVEGQLLFFDVKTEDEDDYLYEPSFFHAKNWEEIDEQLRTYIGDRPALLHDNAILNCTYCKSGILQGETTGVATFGEIQRSQRNPDLKTYGNHFENLDRNPAILCVSCLMELNDEVQEIWPDGVCHDEECPEGTYVRCWRDGCEGNCERKTSREND